MATILTFEKRKINLKNATHIQIFPDATLIFPVEYYPIRVFGEDATKAVEMAKSIGFIGSDELLINPERLAMTETENAIAKLLMFGCPKALIVPVEFLAYLEPAPAPVVSSAGKRGAGDPAKKKSAE